jgi:hypothetical protein
MWFLVDIVIHVCIFVLLLVIDSTGCCYVTNLKQIKMSLAWFGLQLASSTLTKDAKVL